MLAMLKHRLRALRDAWREYADVRTRAIACTLFTAPHHNDGGLVPCIEHGGASCTRTWRAAPGQLLELGDTGYTIKLSTDPSQSLAQLYTLRDPEGRTMCGHVNLATLKRMGEHYARDRDEFAAFGAGLQQAQAAVVQPPPRHP